MRKFKSVDEVVNKLRPVDPIYCIRKNSINTACNWFNKNFPGKTNFDGYENSYLCVIKNITNIKTFSLPW